MYVIELNRIFYIQFKTKFPHNTWDNFDDLEAKNIDQSNLYASNSDEMQHGQRQTNCLNDFLILLDRITVNAIYTNFQNMF